VAHSTAAAGVAAPRDDTISMLVARRLAGAGVRRVFGFPGGGSNLDVVEALADAGIDFALARTETSAAFMACAAAELSGAPGVVLVGNGPGLTSVVNGVAHARLDRVPLLVLSDRYADEERELTGHQVLDQIALLAPLTKLSATLEPRTAAATLDRALELCRQAPRGPVHLDLPRDLGTAPVWPADSDAPGHPATEPADVGRLASRFAGAQRPVVLVGLEAADGVDPDDLLALVAWARAPVLSTYKAKGVFPETHPCWAGILTGGQIEQPILEAADVVLAIGLDPVELLGRPWAPTAEVLSIRADVTGDAYLDPVAGCVGAVGEIVAALARSPQPASASRWGVSEIAAYRDSVAARLRLGPDDALTAWRIVEAVRDAAGDDATVAVDAGAHMFPAAVFWRASRPRGFLISNGLASMGFAVPAAIAAALAEPDRLSVALTGDGGLAYDLAELETAKRLGARILVVVFNDASLSLIRVKQVAAGRRREVLDLGPTAFDVAAAAFGVHGHAAADVAQLRRALGAALQNGGVQLIDARLSGDEYGDTVAVIRG